MISQDDAANFDAVWLLDVEIDGRVYRYTTAPDALRVTRSDGLEYVYHSGLSAIRASSADPSTSAQIVDGTDWAALFAAGGSMEGGRATLRRWWSGLMHDEARIWAAGRAVGAEWGELGEPFIFTIESDDASQTDPILPAGTLALKPLHFGPDRVGGPTFDVWPEVEGLPLPLVIGYPGDMGDGTSREAVPVILTDWCTFVGAGDQETCRVSVSIGRVDATTIYLKERDQFPSGPSYTATIAYATQVSTDGHEETVFDVSYVDFSGTDSNGEAATGLLPTYESSESKAEFLAGFNPTTGGGIANPYSTGTLSGAGDVVIWAMRRSGGDLPVDYEALDRVREHLNAYRIDTFINDETIRALEWLRSQVLPILPVVEITTSQGWALSIVDWTASESDAHGTLTADVDLHRSGSARVINTKGIANYVTISYRPTDAAHWGGWYQQLTLTPDLYIKQDRSALVGQMNPFYPSRIAKISEARHGLRKSEIELPMVWDDNTALRVAQDAIEANGLSTISITYQAATDTLERVRVGDVWLLTDAGMGWAERIAIVTEISVGGNEPPTLVFALPDPLIKRA